MREVPDYFEEIRSRAARRWDQLERDPDLAGPWHQLFKQVQSPRHVVSELLQNADDAGATEATVKLEDGEFVFTHNGEDFLEEHFASLCRFGYSTIWPRSVHQMAATRTNQSSTGPPHVVLMGHSFSLAPLFPTLARCCSRTLWRLGGSCGRG